MEFVKAVRAVGGQARAILTEILPLCMELADAWFEVFLLSCRLAMVVVRPALSLLPYLKHVLHFLSASFVSVAWKAFSGQTPKALAIEAAFFGLLVLIALFEYHFGFLRYLLGIYAQVWLRVSGWYGDFKRTVTSKSKLAAVALSHVVFMIPVFTAMYGFGPILDAFAHRWGLILLGYIRPFYRTVSLLYSLEGKVPSHTENLDSLALETPNRTLRPMLGNRTTSIQRSDENGDLNGTDLSENRDGAVIVTTKLSRQNTMEDSPAARVMQRRRLTSPAPAKSENSGVGKRICKSAKKAPEPNSSFDAPVAENLAVTFTRTPVSTRKSLTAGEHILRDSETEMLRYWVVFGVAWSVKSVVRFFTPALLSPLLCRLDTFLFVFVLWLQLGFTRGADALFPLVASFLRQGRNLRMNASASAEQLNIFLRMVVAFGFIQPEQASSIGSTLSESGVILLGIIFFITPRTITFLGTVLTGCIVPIYHCTYAASPSSHPSTRQTWLAYWAVYTVMEGLYTSVADLADWIPLWYHVKLALILWLQIPYYRGASILLDHTMAYIGRIATMYRLRVLAARKVKRS